MTFQSRLGRDPWIQPFTDVRVIELAQAGVKRLAVLSPAFVADCLETLEELAIRAARGLHRPRRRGSAAGAVAQQRGGLGRRRARDRGRPLRDRALADGVAGPIGRAGGAVDRAAADREGPAAARRQPLSPLQRRSRRPHRLDRRRAPLRAGRGHLRDRRRRRRHLLRGVGPGLGRAGRQRQPGRSARARPSASRRSCPAACAAVAPAPPSRR